MKTLLNMFVAMLRLLNPLRWTISVKENEVRFVRFNKLVYTWPLLVVGYFLSSLQALGVDSETLGWWWVVSAVLVVATVCCDFNRNWTIFMASTIGFIWLFGYKLAEWGFPVWTWLYTHFADMNIAYSSGIVQALSELLTIGFFVNLIYCFAEHRVVINHNEVVELALLRKVASHPRVGARFLLEVPDFLELILGFGAASLRVTRGNRDITFENVPGLFLNWNKIDTLLNTIAVKQQSDQDDDEDAPADSPAESR